MWQVIPVHTFLSNVAEFFSCTNLDASNYNIFLYCNTRLSGFACERGAVGGQRGSHQKLSPGIWPLSFRHTYYLNIGLDLTRQHRQRHLLAPTSILLTSTCMFVEKVYQTLRKIAE